VSDREFIKRAHCPGDKQYNVAGPNQHHIPSFQAKARVDDRVAGIQRQLVRVPVFPGVGGWRNSQMKNAGIMRSLTDDVNYPGRGSGQEQHITRCDSLSQRVGFFHQRLFAACR
jgi:hypothetical protein